MSYILSLHFCESTVTFRSWTGSHHWSANIPLLPSCRAAGQPHVQVDTPHSLLHSRQKISVVLNRLARKVCPCQVSRRGTEGSTPSLFQLMVLLLSVVVCYLCVPTLIAQLKWWANQPLGCSLVGLRARCLDVSDGGCHVTGVN